MPAFLAPALPLLLQTLRLGAMRFVASNAGLALQEALLAQAGVSSALSVVGRGTVPGTIAALELRGTLSDAKYLVGDAGLKVTGKPVKVLEEAGSFCLQVLRENGTWRTIHFVKLSHPRLSKDTYAVVNGAGTEVGDALVFLERLVVMLQRTRPGSVGDFGVVPQAMCSLSQVMLYVGM